MNLSEQSAREYFQSRVSTWVVLFTVLFIILTVRMWHLQVFNGERWRTFSEANRIEIKNIPAIRGKIMDRNGHVLADTRPSFDLHIDLEKTEDLHQTLDNLSILFAWSETQLNDLKTKLDNAPESEHTYAIYRDMSFNDLSLFTSRQYYYPSLTIISSPYRIYPEGYLASHALGYLGEINAKQWSQLSTNDARRYRRGDFLGVSGVERAYEDILRGEDGSIPVIADAYGREQGIESASDLLPAFRAQDPVPGEDVYTTIDYEVHKTVAEAFGDRAGSFVMIKVDTGEILAIMSFPSFLPEEFSRGVSRSYWKTIREDERNPMYNRALRGLYPPASTFKMISGMAALEEKVIDPNEKVHCPGYYRIGREIKRCWHRGGHGWVDFEEAMQKSCDVYFYEVGNRLGIDRIAKYAQKFGLGSSLGVDFGREVKGLVPTSEWKKKRFGRPWVGGETLSVVIGQGYLQTTPLQMAVSVASLVNGGNVLRPYILKSNSPSMALKYGDVISTHAFLEKNIEHVIEGMRKVVNEPGGTAYYTARSQRIAIAGKTGTAQVVSLSAKTYIPDHAWFIAFAPIEEPEIALAVIVEHGGHGGAAAAPIAKKAIETYFRDKDIDELAP